MESFLIRILFFTSCSILTISNLSAQWIFTSALTDLGPYPAVSIYSPDGVIAAGGGINSPKVYKSTNGGSTWINISGNLSGPKIYSVCAINENLIFAGDGGSASGNGGNAKLWKSTNGGLNWVTVLSTGGTDGFFNGIVFSKSNPLFGIAVSDAPNDDFFYVAKTTDGGATWTTQKNTPSGYGLYCVLGSVICIDSIFYGWGIGPDNARVIFTTNGGISWTIKSINLTGSPYTSGLAFNSNKTIGLAVGSESLPYISRSTNGGDTWTAVNTNLSMKNSEYSRIKWVHGTDICYITSIIGPNGCIGKSTNGGLNWSIMNTSELNAVMALDAIQSGNEVFGCAVSGYGYILRLQEPTIINPIGISIPSKFSLEQNYPNPFNPSTKIIFHVALAKHITLQIFDIEGKHLKTLISEVLSPGSYEVVYNSGLITSGVYFYTLFTENFSETKKMIFLK